MLVFSNCIIRLAPSNPDVKIFFTFRWLGTEEKAPGSRETSPDTGRFSENVIVGDWDRRALGIAGIPNCQRYRYNT